MPEFEKEKEQGNDIIAGRNPVIEAVKSGREIDRLLIAHGMTGGWAAPIIAKCSERGILIKEVSPQKLDYLTGGANHQGIAVMCVFTGDDQDIPAAKTIYGRNFARIRHLEQFADTVGTLIQNQIRSF